MSKVCAHGDEWVFRHPESGSWCVACLTKKNGDLSALLAASQTENERLRRDADLELQEQCARWMRRFESAESRVAKLEGALAERDMRIEAVREYPNVSHAVLSVLNSSVEGK